MQKSGRIPQTLLFSLLCLMLYAIQGYPQGVLFFGKSFDVRSSMAISQANLPAQIGISAQNITNPTPLYWQEPRAGNLYAAPNNPQGLAPYTLLMGQVLDSYNPATAVIYEAPPHPYLIQSISAGGTTVIAGYHEKGKPQNAENFTVAYGGPRIAIALAGGNPDIVLGIPNAVVISIPPGLAAAWLRVDFGSQVILAGFGTNQIFTIPVTTAVMTLNVTFPMNYSGESIALEAVATQGIFTDRSPSSLTGPGINSTSSCASGVASFGVQRIPASLNVSVTADRTVVRSGGRVRFTYTAINGSAIPLQNVELVVTSFPKIAIGALPAGGSSSASQEKEDVSTDITERALASATDAFNNPVLSSQAEFTVRVISPALRCHFWANDLEIKAGKDLVLNATADNDGDVKLLGVTINITPSGPRGLGDLEVGQSGSSQVTTRISATTTFTAVATAVDEVLGSAVSSDPIEVMVNFVQPAIQVELSADKSSVKAGKEVFYSGLVRNIGTTDLRSIIIVDDQGYQIASIASLAPGTMQGFRFSRKIQQNTTTTVVATALDPWNDPINGTASVNITVVSPKISLSMNVDKTEAGNNEDITMTIAVTNIGNCDIDEISIATFGAGIGNINCGRLAVGASNTQSKTFRISQSITVSAQASGIDPENEICLSNSVDQALVYQKSIGELLVFPEFDALEKEINALAQKFDYHVSNFLLLFDIHDQQKTDPSSDGTLLQELAAAKAALTAAQGKLSELAALLKAQENLLSTIATQAHAGINPKDLPSYLARLVACNSRVREMGEKVAAMEGLLKEKRLTDFTISGQVLFEGKPVGPGQVICGPITAPVDAGGAFTIANLQGEKGQSFTLTAFKDQLTGGTAVTFDGKDIGGVVITVAEPQQSAAAPGTLDDAIASLQGDEEELCTPEAIASIKAGLDFAIAASPAIYSKFNSYYEKLQKEIRDQSANPCNNAIIAYCLANGQNQASEHALLAGKMHSAANEIIVRASLCPEVGSLQDALDIVAEIDGRDAEIQGKVQLMSAALQPYGCDQDKMEQDGQRIADSGNDPEFIQDGGLGREIPGDGVDNNADGLQDELIPGDVTGNVVIFIYDSGSLKDDVFSLSVSGQGDLGTTPAGGGRTYGLSLAAGGYVATVTVISAPDNVGTFTILIKQGDETLASLSGAPPEGGQSSISFTVK